MLSIFRKYNKKRERGYMTYENNSNAFISFGENKVGKNIFSICMIFFHEYDINYFRKF